MNTKILAVLQHQLWITTISTGTRIREVILTGCKQTIFSISIDGDGLYSHINVIHDMKSSECLPLQYPPLCFIIFYFYSSVCVICKHTATLKPVATVLRIEIRRKVSDQSLEQDQIETQESLKLSAGTRVQYVLGFKWDVLRRKAGTPLWVESHSY